MRLFPAVLALLPLATASLHARQDSGVEITETRLVGPGCPSDTLEKAPSNSTTDAAVSFDAYESVLRSGSPNSERDVHCQVFVTMRFPAGCTAATISTTYTGSASVSGGATAVVAPSYRLTGGTLDVGENAPTFIEGNEEYERVDDIAARVESDEEQELQFIVRSRSFIQTVGEEGGGEGSVTADAISVAIKSSESC